MKLPVTHVFSFIMHVQTIYVRITHLHALTLTHWHRQNTPVAAQVPP